MTEINKTVDDLRVGLRDLRHVVLVGSDDALPFGRVPDRTASFSEADAGLDFALRGTHNATTAALAESFVLSDNPYGDVSPSTLGADPVYLPQLAVGRLVETPADIMSAVDVYMTSHGIRTPTASFNAAYDWMLTAGQQVDAAVGPDVATRTTKLDTDLLAQANRWTKTDAAAGLEVAAHGFFSINAHSDPTQTLSSADWGSKTATPDLLTTSDLPDDLANGIGLTLGCHMGLNLADTFVANPNPAEQAALHDWSQAILHNKGVLMAPTGYGLGEKTSLAYSARLLADFASEGLDGTSSIGQGLVRAKQEYVRLGVPSVYDIKALHEATFYGLPMYRLGSTGRVMGSFLPEEGTPTGTPPANATTSVTYQPAASALEQVTTPDGSYFTVADAPPQVTPNQPIQPLTSIDLPSPNAKLTARDAVPEQMTSYDVAGFDPVYATESVAAVPASAREPAVKVAAFPSRTSQVITTVDQGKIAASLAFIPGHFATDGSGGGKGNQRIFTKATFTVNWSASSDFERPDISTVSATLTGTTASFRVCSPATDVNRGVLLFLPSGGPNPQDWVHVELVKSTLGCWVGTATVAAGVTAIGQYHTMLCDTAGNCGASTNKARNYTASPSTQLFSLAVDPGPASNGLYPDPTTVTITAPAGTTFTASVDDLPPISCTGTCFVTVTGDGAHVVRAVSGGITTEAAIPIDTHPPVVDVTSPPAGARYRQGEVVATSFSCSSALTVTACGGPESLDTATPGSHTVSFTATDQFGLSTTVQRTYIVDGTPPTLSFGSGPPVITNAGTATFTFSGVDPDEPGYAVAFTCKLDDGPAEPCTSPYVATLPSPPDGAHVFTVEGHDRVGNAGSATYSWDVDTAAPMFQSFIGPADPSTQTTATFAYLLDGPATVACTLDGVAKPCSSTGATIPGLTPRIAPYVFKATATDAGGNTSTVQHSWHVYSATELVATSVIEGLPRLTATLTTVPGGAPVAGQKVRFTRGAGTLVVCAGAAADGTVLTAANGVATCNVTLLQLLQVVFSWGYTAKFAGNPPYLGSQGSAGVL